MGRGPGISIRDRLIVWNSKSKGINSSTQIKKLFDDLDEREISLDSIRRLIKESEDFKRLLPEYPELTEELKGLVAGGGIISVSYFSEWWEYTCPSVDVINGKLVGATVKNEGDKELKQVHAYVVISTRSTKLGWVEQLGEFIDIPPGAGVRLGVINTIEADDELYGRVLSWRDAQVMGAPLRPLPHRTGCWISSPNAIHIPTEGDAYLPPGEHEATLYILYGENQKFTQQLMLQSPEDWKEAALKIKSLEI